MDLGRIAGQKLNALEGQAPLDPYAPGDFGAQRDAVTDAQYRAAAQYLDPQYDRGEAALRTRLLNSGVREGSEAYANEMDAFSRQKQMAYGDARDRALLSGGQEQSRLLADALRGRQQTVAERELPLQEYLQLASGIPSGAGGNPAVPAAGTPQPGDYQGAVQAGYNAQSDIYNWNQARNAQNTNSLINLAGIAAAYYSDRRLKRDIEPTGETHAGMPLYTFRYLWNDQQYLGLMADDVERVAPHAVFEMNGYKAVNYGAL